MVETTATQASELKSTNASLQQHITDLEQKKKQIEESAVSASVQTEEATAKITTLTDQIEQLRTELAAGAKQRLRAEEEAETLRRQLAEAQAERARPAEPKLPDSASTILQVLTGSLAGSKHEFLKHFSEDQLGAIIKQTLSTAFEGDGSLTILDNINAAIHTDLLTDKQQKSISTDQMTDDLIDFILKERGQSDLVEGLKQARKEVDYANQALSEERKIWLRLRIPLSRRENANRLEEDLKTAKDDLNKLEKTASFYID